MSELKIVLANLKSNFEHFDFALIKPPSYVKSLSNNDEKIIFVYKYEVPQNNLKDESFRKNENVEKPANLDLTGSPLKDNITFDGTLDMSLDLKLSSVNSWSTEEECYKPIPIDDAREILQYAVLNLTSAIGSIWCFCAIDSYSEQNILLHYDFDPIWFSRGIVNIDGIRKFDDMEIEHMLDRHNFHINSNKLQTHITTVFNLKPNIAIQLDWSTDALIPSLYTYKHADILLKQTVKIGYDKNTKNFWSQIYQLHMIKEDIVAHKMKKNNKTDPTYPTGSNVDLKTIFDNIVKILTNTDLSLTEMPIDNNGNCMLEGVIDIVKNRTNLDITDQLWNVLSICNSFEDLQKAFALIFQTAVKSNITNLPTNSNRLGELIRDLAQQRIAIPCLTGSQSLELLLEIGLEKIIKDFEMIFSQSKILDINFSKMNPNEAPLTEPQLNLRKSLHNAQRKTTHGNGKNTSERKTLLHSNLENEFDKSVEIGFQNSSFNESDVNFKLAKLAQVHIIMEHLLMIEINLNLDNVYTSITKRLLQRPLVNFGQLRQVTCDSIEISLLHDRIVSLLEDIKPHTRRVHMTSENKLQKIENIFYHSVNPIFPTNVIDYFNIEDGEISADKYWCLHYMKIGTKRA